MRGAEIDIAEKGRELRGFLGFAGKRFSRSRCLRMAASLSYTSLLAVVPLTAIAFSMLAAFPVFEGIREELQNAVFGNFLPQSAQAMREYFDQFVQNTTRLTAVGIVGLALTAILLLGTIEADLNAIFRVGRPRAVVPRLLVFWALITLGPLLLGASFSLSTYFFALTQLVGVGAVQGTVVQLTQILPTLMVMVALTLCYAIVPNRRVNLLNAVIGGVVAGLLFAFLRKGFGLYVSRFPTYQTIYGAVSVVPIFLVWMYLSWAVLLLGAVLTATLGEWRAGVRRVGAAPRPEDRLVAALQILDRLLEASQSGRGVSRSGILKDTGLGGDTAEELLAKLGKAGFVDQASRRDWVLVRDLSAVTLYDLMRDLGLVISGRSSGLTAKPWRGRLTGRLTEINDLLETGADTTLRDLLVGPDTPRYAQSATAAATESDDDGGKRSSS